MQSEGEFQKEVIKFLSQHDDEVWFVKYWAGGRYTKEGIPDILACINGDFHGIELKSDGKGYNETKLQALNLQHLNQTGGHGYVLRPTAKPGIKHPEFDYYCTTFKEWEERWFDD